MTALNDARTACKVCKVCKACGRSISPGRMGPVRYCPPCGRRKKTSRAKRYQAKVRRRDWVRDCARCGRQVFEAGSKVCLRCDEVAWYREYVNNAAHTRHISDAVDPGRSVRIAKYAALAAAGLPLFEATLTREGVA